MAETRSSRRFLTGLLIYILILSLLGGAALFMLRSYLTVYEATRPETAMKAYFTALTGEPSTEGCRAAIAELDESIRPASDNLAFALALLRDAGYTESISQSSAEEKVYLIHSGDELLGEVRLRPGEETRYRLRAWEPVEEHFDFSAYFRRVSVTVPQGFRVFLGDNELGENCVVDRAVPYESLSGAYGDIEGLPCMLRYESGLFLGNLPLRVVNAQGTEIPEEKQREAYYLDNCGDETRTAVESFAGDFLPLYILFTGDVNQEGDDYYGILRRMVVPGSPLSVRLEECHLNSWWSWIVKCTLLDLDLHFCTDLGDGRILADLSYTTRTEAFASPVTETFNIRLLLTATDDRLLATALYNY